MRHHLALQALIAGIVPGQVYVDDREAPGSALAWTQGRYFIGDSPDGDELIKAVRHLFNDSIYPVGRTLDRRMFTMFFSHPDWSNMIGGIFPDKELALGSRHAFECRSLRQDWRPLLPDDQELLPVDENLLGRRDLKNLEALKEDMGSERLSVEEFLARSFGVCLVHNDAIIGWCLSEYNWGDRCEIGIEVVDAHQRKGMGTLLSLALVEQAASRGIARIGWHSRASNIASSATALKAGFEHVMDHPAFYGRFDG